MSFPANWKVYFKNSFFIQNWATWIAKIYFWRDSKREVSKQLCFVNHSYVSSSQPNTAFRDNLTSQTVNTLFNFATGLSLALRITARTQPTYHFRWKKRKIREYLFIYFFDVYFSIQKPFKKNKNTQNVLLSWITLSYVFLRQT